MGNCFHRCFGIVGPRKKYTQYNTPEQDFSIEFESLIDGDSQENDMTRLLTDRERQLLQTKQFGVLVHEQGKIDAEIEAKLSQHEKEIEREEAAFYEAKREAARLIQLNRDKENSSTNNSQNWASHADWQVAGDEEDFEHFLANVKARSLASKSHGTNDSDEAWSSDSSSAHTRDRSLAKGGFVEVNWDQEAGMAAQLEVSAQTPGNSLSKSTVSEQEWDLDFVSADGTD